MQAKFYDDVICNRNARARFWGIYDFVEQEQIYADYKPISPFKLIGMTGLENIEWENRLGEISIILNPEQQRKGYGEQAVKMLLEKGFNYMNLENIYGESYLCNTATKFWLKMATRYRAKTRTLPNRKYWNGAYYNSLYFSFNKGRFTKCLK
jgi:RimJ/RimL family protein N-acetyltransferase